MEKKKSSHVTKGIVLALVFVVLDVVANFAKIKMEGWYRWGSLLLMLAAFVVVCIQFSNENDNRVTFGQIFGHGFKASLVVAVIFLIYTVLSLYVIFPEQKEQLMQQQMLEWDKSGMTEDQKSQAMTMMDKMFLPIALIGAVLGPILIGVVGSLLGGAFAKKKPVTPFDQTV